MTGARSLRAAGVAATSARMWEQLIAFGALRGDEGLPGGLAPLLDEQPLLLLYGVQLCRAGQAGGQNPQPQLAQAIEFGLPGQALLALVALMAAAGGVPLGLAEVDNMDDGRHMLLTRGGRSALGRR